jgi:uncharacterized tellurite resistance protein B-like protein
MLQLVYLVSLLAVIIICQVYGFPRVPRTAPDPVWAATNDPRVAAAVMMVIVAAENGPPTTEKEEQIVSLLQSRVGLEPDLARECLTASQQIAIQLRGDLGSRLDRLLEPIRRNCTRREKQDMAEMLEAVAGANAVSPGPMREELARVAAALLRD